jgi:hypothetical protein
MNLYEAGKTQKILKQIPKFKDYNNIKIVMEIEWELSL